MKPIQEFIDFEACIDIQNEMNFDVNMLASILRDAGVKDFRGRDLSEYIQECVNQDWEILFFDKDSTLNACKGDYAQDKRSTLNVYTPSEFIGESNIEIEDEEWNEILERKI